ncbi:hypothetical protein [Streptomyces anulatus]|uniref:hypothetical protein n=1 Tax=Streptomyces anulatus TaxID=1892 RepID=UPI00331F556D
MLLTTARHPGVVLEFSSHRPRHMSKPGSGWEPLLHHARVVFGTSTWVNPGPTGPPADEPAALPLPADVVAAWLSGNAEALVARAAGTHRG